MLERCGQDMFLLENEVDKLAAASGYTEITPALVVAMPVGFVNVVESKEMVMERDVPFIVPKGRKGGSNIAATICNSMIYYKG